MTLNRNAGWNRHQPTYACECKPVFGAWYPDACPIHGEAVETISTSTGSLKPRMRLSASAPLELPANFREIELSEDGVRWKRVSQYGAKYVRLAQYGRGELPPVIVDRWREKWTKKMRKWAKTVPIVGALVWEIGGSSGPV